MIQIITGLKNGEGYEGMQANWGQAASIIASGESDAVVLPELFPGGRPSAVGAAGKMMGWSMPIAACESYAMQQYTQAPGNAPVLVLISDLEEKMGED